MDVKSLKNGIFSKKIKKNKKKLQKLNISLYLCVIINEFNILHNFNTLRKYVS
jgi:hypothetical protein